MAHAAEEQYERKLRPIYDALDARSWKVTARRWAARASQQRSSSVYATVACAATGDVMLSC